VKGADLEAALGPFADLIADLIADRVARRLAERVAPPPAEMVTPRQFARDHSIAVTTVRAMIRDGRLQATRIGQRQWRVRRDAQIGTSASGRSAPVAAGETPAARARRILGGGR
jgi:excisionase family DNA binding protein